MTSLLTGPLGPVVGFVIALIAAWKATHLLGAENQMMAVLVATAFAIVGPMLLGDVVAASLAGTPVTENEALKTVGQDMMQMPAFRGAGLRLGCALAGVLLWCGVERAT